MQFAIFFRCFITFHLHKSPGKNQSSPKALDLDPSPGSNRLGLRKAQGKKIKTFEPFFLAKSQYYIYIIMLYSIFVYSCFLNYIVHVVVHTHEVS